MYSLMQIIYESGNSITINRNHSYLTMLLRLEHFISPDLATAPKYSAKKVPNLVLRRVPLDCNSYFEVWSPRSGAILNREERNLLKQDRLRLEVICTKLTWLLGATCYENEDYLLEQGKKLSDWEQVKYYSCRYHFYPDVIDIIFSPQIVRPQYNNVIQKPTHWIIEPPCWEICLLQLKPVNEGYIAEERSPELSIFVWTGQPIIKSIIAV